MSSPISATITAAAGRHDPAYIQFDPFLLSVDAELHLAVHGAMLQLQSLEAMEIRVDIPPLLPGQSTEELAKRVRLLLVIDEVHAGRLTRPGAARALEMSLDDFVIEAGRHGLYAIDYEADDFRRELQAITKDRV